MNTRNCKRGCPEIFEVAQSRSTSFGPPKAYPRTTSVPTNYAKSLVPSSYNRSFLNESSTSCQRTPGAYNIIHNAPGPPSDACPYEQARSTYWTLCNSKYRSNTDDVSGFHSVPVASSEVDGPYKHSGGICPSINAHAFHKYASTSQSVSDTSGLKSEPSEPSPTYNFCKSYSGSLNPLYNSQGSSKYTLDNRVSFDPSNSDISEFKSDYNVPSSRSNYHSGSFCPLCNLERNSKYSLTDQSMFDRYSFDQSNNEFNTTTRAVNTKDFSSADNNYEFQPDPLYEDRVSFMRPGMFDPLVTVPKSSSEEMWDAQPSGVMRAAPCEAVELGRRLLAAADQGLEKEVRALLDAGVAVDFRDAPGRWTALHLAAMGGHPRVVALLLGRGASLRICGPFGFSALHVATFKDYSGWCVRLLIDAGAELDAKNFSGRTPLHYAAEYSNKAAVRALLQAGASTLITTNNKKTARDVATSKKIRRILDVFRNPHLPVF